jgi:hypothetical protein
MMRRLFSIATWCALLLTAPAASCLARTEADAPEAVWTAIIPDAFPDYVYTWRFKPDGSYREDGRDAAKGTPIQPTLSGRWSRDGSHMLLKQSDLPYVFDGVVLGGLYTGTLYFGGRVASRFCAAKGEEAPTRCDTRPGVAAIGVLNGP